MGFKVGDKFRTNELSTVPGGVTVQVKLKNGRKYDYDKIKNPDAYIKRLQGNPDVEWAKVKE